MWPVLLIGGSALALTNVVNSWTKGFQGWLYGTQGSNGNVSGGVLQGAGAPVQISVTPTQSTDWSSWLSYLGIKLPSGFSLVVWVAGLLAVALLLKEVKELVRG